MASIDRELDALVAARRIASRADLLEQAKGGRWAGWAHPRWVFLQVIAVLVVGGVVESQQRLVGASAGTLTGICLAGLLLSHVMLLGQRMDAAAALAQPDDMRGGSEP